MSSFPSDAFSIGSSGVHNCPPTAETRQPKDPRYKAKYNVFSRLLFLWVDPLFWTGCKKELNHNHLYAHPQEADAESLLNQFNRNWLAEIRRKRRGKKTRLWMAIFKCVWWRMAFQCLLTLMEMVLVLSQAVVLGRLIDYFRIEEPTDKDEISAYCFAFGLVIIAVMVLFVHAHAFYTGETAGMMARIMTTTAIYQKILKLSQVTIGKLSAGHIVNLASNDVQRFDLAFGFLPYIVIGPLHLIAVTCLVYLEVGWSTFLMTGFVILQIPVQIGLARIFAYFRTKSVKVTDKRIRIMNEVIVGIRVIKMYAWEYAFKRVVSKLRRLESSLVLKGGVVRAMTSAFKFSIATPFMLFLTFIGFVAAGGELTPRNVFVTLLLIEFLKRSIISYTIRSFFFAYEARVALARIQKLLELDDYEGQPFSTEKNSAEDIPYADLRSVAKLPKKVYEGISEGGYFRPVSPDLLRASASQQSASSGLHHCHVTVEKVSASWSNETEKLILGGINFEMKMDMCSHLLAVIGPVGSGKSTLLQLLIKELSPVSGSVVVDGKVSYASQEPWVSSGTLRENVLFGLPYKPEWYQKVIEACSLDKDIKQLVDGDLTLVGERGVTLSGGQKARVNLARAVYHDADVVILDDPLSAVDTVVARHMFEECIQGLLGNRLVILVTHQVQYALQADKLLVLNEGLIQAYGPYSELAAKGVDTVQLLGLIGDDQERGEKFVYDETLVQDPPSEVKMKPNERKEIIHSACSVASLASEVCHGQQEETSGPPAEEKAHGSVSMKTYFQFFMAGSGYLLLVVLIFAFIIAESSSVVADWWISDWADCSVQNLTRQTVNSTNNGTCSLGNLHRIWTYIGLILSMVILHSFRGTLFYFTCVNASRVLHNRMFASVLRAPVLFFDNNPSGRILNRFSKDIGFLDDLLPHVFLEYLYLLTRLCVVIITAVIANYWILLPAATVVVAFLALKWYYLKTAREVKRLEAISRSPLYSHISMTLQGLATIRTFGKQDVVISQLFTYQNQHTQGWYLYISMARWFAIRIDLLSTLLLAVVAFASIPLASSLNAGLVGLALTYTISLAGTVQFCVRQSAEVENTMISTERIMEYSRLEPEAELETLPPNEKPPPIWPDKGTITMEDVAFQYSSELPLVLKDLCFTIQPAEKVGVVGRTGAGKSSLISVLYRLAEPHGLITVDGVDTKAIGLHDLRKKMSIIPQDPVLFSGTMRYNLDPFDEYTDTELWEALEQVQLKSAVQQLEGQLEGEVSEGGSNFSVGQRQLLCLARALLRKNKILVLDEATANVDIKTDEIIQQAIRENFSECTVVTIAHRLNTIMDSDRILVMNKGQMKEFDSPYNLLQDPRSLFYKMVQKTGPSASRKLQQMARDAHVQRRTLIDAHVRRTNL